MELADRIESYLTAKLYPFWYQRVAAPEGGFTTYFDRNGKPTGQTDKTIIQQTRSIFMLSHAIRNGYGAGKAEGLLGARAGVVPAHVPGPRARRMAVDRGQGRENPCPRTRSCTARASSIYAMSECALATGDAQRTANRGGHIRRSSRSTRRTPRYGGYREMFLRDWQPRPSGAYGGDRKSFDVHMHLMEAYTTLLELTGAEIHRRKLLEVIDVLWSRMFHAPIMDGDGPVRPGLHARFPRSCSRRSGAPIGTTRERRARSNNTSYGHNIEFLWLFLHALSVLGISPDPWKERLQALARHTVTWGVDPEYGGVYVEGPHDGPARDTQKEFWQQAESLVGLLDCYLLFQDRVYWDAFRKVFDFVWDSMINHDVGEWFALLDRDGTVKWDYLGHAWKNNYHTTRSMVQTLRRLREISRRGMEP